MQSSTHPWQFVFLALLLATVRTLAAEPEQESKSVATNALSTSRLILPETIPAVVGIECNLYFDNVVLTALPGRLLFDVVCAKGRQQSERWTWVPTEADVGAHPLELIVRDEANRKLISARCIVQVAAANRGTGKSLTVLMIGDSLTHASTYPQRVVERSESSAGPKVVLVGSHTPKPENPMLRHEGYGGWTAKRFVTHYTETARTGEYAKRGSPFLYKPENEAPRLDFTAYCRDVNEGRFPDVATIFLGPNDTFSFDDDTIEAGVDEMLKYLDQLVEMLQTASPSTKISLMLPVPPAASQDAFGSNYGSGQTRWQYRRNQHRVVERMFERYGRAQPGTAKVNPLRLIPTYLGLDCVNNYPTEQVAANGTTDIKITRQSNGVHPAGAGYQQIGDIVFAWLKNEMPD
ncbi:SGNH/GDSL hydrolase family protein [Schlesneria paludicola]|uniref:SGNH/GDSL hydrolase family protein n=1 Tax=Schlesneria paludicola TaxID=360056 RepID=UPI00029AF7A3|nr:SGNH/GDSL hydrolase family protein [Schlesneria paludicola]